MIFPKMISIPPYTLIIFRTMFSIITILGHIHRVLRSLSVNIQLYAEKTFLKKMNK